MTISNANKALLANYQQETLGQLEKNPIFKPGEKQSIVTATAQKVWEMLPGSKTVGEYAGSLVEAVYHHKIGQMVQDAGVKAAWNQLPKGMANTPIVNGLIDAGIAASVATTIVPTTMAVVTAGAPIVGGVLIFCVTQGAKYGLSLVFEEKQEKLDPKTAAATLLNPDTRKFENRAGKELTDGVNYVFRESQKINIAAELLSASSKDELEDLKNKYFHQNEEGKWVDQQGHEYKDKEAATIQKGWKALTKESDLADSKLTKAIDLFVKHLEFQKRTIEGFDEIDEAFAKDITEKDGYEMLELEVGWIDLKLPEWAVEDKAALENPREEYEGIQKKEGEDEEKI